MDHELKKKLEDISLRNKEPIDVVLPDGGVCEVRPKEEIRIPRLSREEVASFIGDIPKISKD